MGLRAMGCVTRRRGLGEADHTPETKERTEGNGQNALDAARSANAVQPLGPRQVHKPTAARQTAAREGEVDRQGSVAVAHDGQHRQRQARLPQQQRPQRGRATAPARSAAAADDGSSRGGGGLVPAPADSLEAGRAPRLCADGSRGLARPGDPSDPGHPKPKPRRDRQAADVAGVRLSVA